MMLKFSFAITLINYILKHNQIEKSYFKLDFFQTSSVFWSNKYSPGKVIIKYYFKNH